MRRLLSRIPALQNIYRFFFRIHLEKKRHLRFFKTLWFNFHFFPWNQAIHCPVFIYGKLTIEGHEGSLCLNIPTDQLYPGMIRLGYNYDRFSTNYAGTLLQLQGTLQWNGPFRCSVNNVIGACQAEALVQFGAYVSLGANVKLRAYRCITIADHVAVTHDCGIYDTDFHPFRNIDSGEIPQYMTPIHLGQGSFIGFGTQITKGTVLPPYSLVAACSLLNRDYSQEQIEAPFIAGVPARIKHHGMVRIFEQNIELMAMSHFKENDTSLFVHQGLPSDLSGRMNSFR